jgi:hypothetical protein
LEKMREFKEERHTFFLKFMNSNLWRFFELSESATPCRNKSSKKMMILGWNWNNNNEKNETARGLEMLLEKIRDLENEQNWNYLLSESWNRSADSIEKKFEGIPRNKTKWREMSKKVKRGRNWILKHEKESE